MSAAKIKVMLVDDSAVVRQVLGGVLSKDPQIEVIGAASDPIFALDRMKNEWPDVLILDVEMPRMDGITFLKQIMSTHPTPVVICSTLTEKGAATSLQAMAAGAVDIVTKPKVGLKHFLETEAAELIGAVKGAAKANMRRMQSTLGASMLPIAPLVAAQASADSAAMAATTDRVVAIGASTGGTQALERVLSALPRVSPGIVIVQHMPEAFTRAFAARLDSVCQIEVLEAKTGDRVLPGRALIAPGGRHMTLRRNGAQYCVDVIDGPPVNRHRPSVDVLFRSVAKSAGANAKGIIMTGMGDDGARGLKAMLEAGADTLGQDEQTCVVYGMPMQAMKMGSVQKELPLGSIPGEIMRGYRV